MRILLIFNFMLAMLAKQSLARLDYFNVERCSAGGELMELNTVPERHALLFHEITFSCEGKVAFWEFNSNKNRGKFYASVWRNDRVTGEVILVGKNEISAIQKGYQEYEVPKEERIDVRSGDFIGIHYPQFEKEDGMINIEVPQGIGKPTHQVGTLASNFSKFEFGNKDLPRGIRLTAPANLPGKPSLRGRVHNVNPYMQLAGGSKSYEGRAEIKEEDIWGTVCDKWYEIRGWPMLFCSEMGYPNVSSVVKWASEVNEVFDATKLVPVPPIHMQSPKCKLSQNISFFNCEIHENGGCQHDLDVVIRCQPKVRLDQPLTAGVGHRHEGIPLYYHYGEWGLICDDRDFMWHIQNRKRSWVTAVCRELNYVGFADLFPVSDFQVKKFDTIWAFPECHEDNPNLVSQCPPRPTEEKCEHTSYFIRCQRTYLSNPSIF